MIVWAWYMCTDIHRIREQVTIRKIQKTENNRFIYLQSSDTGIMRDKKFNKYYLKDDNKKKCEKTDYLNKQV